ncbi:MAG: magnesium protoporphyrin IX methyltransferase, partial [Cyanobacteria bacterium P01_H01_bin.58]
MTNAVDDKTVVREYFNATGFDRWRRIYGDDSDVNKVQLDIRKGHQKTVDTLMGWLRADNNLADLSICDAGCGVGSLSLPLAQAGAQVNASDISAKMVDEARERAEAILKPEQMPNFQTSDLEDLSGKFHTVVCLDVLIHYPQEKAADMIKHLGSLAESRVILSFAPKTCFYSFLKKVGSFFPGPSKATRA